jgi:hypothetical protein
MKSWRFHQAAVSASEGLFLSDETIRERRGNVVSRFRAGCCWRPVFSYC